MRFKRFGITALLGMAALSVAQAAQSDRPIVYSARYYTSPTSKETSFYHLYRCNTDGTGIRQVSFGKKNDSTPHWSPDGRRILFLRDNKLWIMNADGSAEHGLYDQEKDGYDRSAEWTPDSREILVTNSVGEALLVSVSTGSTRQDNVTPPLAPKVQADKNGIILTRFNPNGSSWKIPLKFTPALQKKMSMGDFDPEIWTGCETIPHSNMLLVWQITGDSTQGHWSFYFLADEKAGSLSYFAEGAGLHFSPDATHYVTTRGRDLVPLTQKDKRQVWVSPLLLGAVRNGTSTARPLIHGMVDVTGCDWRPTP